MKQKLLIPLVVLSLLVALAGPVSAAPPAPGFTITAQKGDTYSTLSWKYGVSVDRLLKANGLERNGEPLTSKKFWLAPGQQVVVPIELGATPSLVNPFLYVTQQGDTLGLLSVRFEIAAWTVAKVNGGLDAGNLTQALTPGATLLVPAGPHVHKMGKGETLAQVAAKYGVTEAYLLKANSIAEGKAVASGAELTIPVQYDRPFTPIGSGQPLAVGNPPTPALAPAIADAGGPLTFRWIAQNSPFAPVGEGRAVATFTAEFKGGQAPFKVYIVNWGQYVSATGPFLKADNGQQWTDLDFAVNAKCGETFTLHVEVQSADGQKAFSIREFGPVACK